MKNVKAPAMYLILSSNVVNGTWGCAGVPGLECAQERDNWHRPAIPSFPIGFGDGHAKFINDHLVLSQEQWRMANGINAPYYTKKSKEP